IQTQTAPRASQSPTQSAPPRPHKSPYTISSPPLAHAPSPPPAPSSARDRISPVRHKSQTSYPANVDRPAAPSHISPSPPTQPHHRRPLICQQPTIHPHRPPLPRAKRHRSQRTKLFKRRQTTHSLRHKNRQRNAGVSPASAEGGVDQHLPCTAHCARPMKSQL